MGEFSTNLVTLVAREKTPSKIYPNWDFWFEKKPSGDPVADSPFFSLKKAALNIGKVSITLLFNHN
jgi:hypothetical protein